MGSYEGLIPAVTFTAVRSDDPDFMQRPVNAITPDEFYSQAGTEDADRLQAGAPTSAVDAVYGLRQEILHRQQILDRHNQKET